MTRHFVYVVICSDNTLYTGYSTDVTKRVAAHNAGRGAKYTRTRRPVVLAYTRTFLDKREALAEEYQIKQMARQNKILHCDRYYTKHSQSKLP